MTGEDGAGRAGGLDGRPVEAAVASVTERPDVIADEQQVRSALQLVSEDGVVSRDAVDDAVADVSMRVSNAQGRVEHASVEYDETATAVEHVSNVGIVATYLDEFGRRRDAMAADVADVEADLQAVVGRDETADLYELARDLSAVQATANGLQQRADQLLAELQEFERWVSDPAFKLDDLETDLHALADWLDDVEATADRIEAARDGDEEFTDREVAAAWFETTVQVRARALVVDDVRADLDGLRELAARRDDGLERADAVEARLDDLDDRVSRLADRLNGMARTAWIKEYGDHLAAVGESFQDMEPPIDWGQVEATLAEQIPEQQTPN